MRHYSGSHRLVAVLALFQWASLAQSTGQVFAESPPEGFRSLFDGKTLTGWDGNPALWSVEDGCVVGKTQGPETLTYNQFLIWRGGVVKDFELRVKIKQSGNNSGIQYRSREMQEVGPWSVAGYQCDIHPNKPYHAMMYEERGRGVVAKNGQTIAADEQGQLWILSEKEPTEGNTEGWNEYTLIAQGNRLTHKVNGSVTAEFTDGHVAKRALEGLLAFQIHRGPAMSVHIKDVFLKDLPSVAPLPVVIPESARKVADKATPAAPQVKVNGPITKKDEPVANNSENQTVAVKPDRKRRNVAPPVLPNTAVPSSTIQSSAAPNSATAEKKDGEPKIPEGKATGQNVATPVKLMKPLKDFQVELLYSVPGDIQGSWVNLCTDDKGRLLVSDQYGGLFRINPPAPGQTVSANDVEKVPANIRAVNGMVWAFGALYVGVNDYESKIPSGLYRISDSNGDDQLDRVELLRALDSKGDHGVHAVVPTPDGKGLYLVCGNSTKLTTSAATSQVPRVWGEDHLLPRMPDGRGFMRDVMGPGGIIYRVTPDGKDFEIYAAGFRNIFDASLNHDGELFTYDADMEYDFNTSWYRPTRICHVVSGAEYGWRNGAGKRPVFYADNLPPVLDIGPGSPTGTTFGYGAKFPAKYQKALYALDWSWGKLYAVHLESEGSTYKATKEEFLVGSPLPITDAIIHPKDGAMYFTMGGRKVQSGLYRITYTGTEATHPVHHAPTTTPARDLRHQLEAYHGKQDPQAIEIAWPHLNSSDRFIRWAARTALEHQPAKDWGAKALTEPDAARRIEALMALARVAGVCPQHRTESTAAPDVTLGAQILDSLNQLNWQSLPLEWQQAYVRTLQIAMNRFGPVDNVRRERFITSLEAGFPSKNYPLNWLLCETLVALQSPQVAAKAMTLIANAPGQEEQIEYARSLRMLTAGWTLETRTAYFEWLLKAANYRGGASFSKFVEFIRNDAIAHLTDDEKNALASVLDRKPETKSVIETLGAVFEGRSTTNWTLEELSAAAETGLKGRDFQNGRKMFTAAACYSCHRFGSDGGMTGPDLTAAGRRYSPHDFLDQVINPSKVINEQFSAMTVETVDGKVYTGVLVNLKGDTITLNTDLTDPNQRVNIDRKKIENMEPSKTSPMPANLLGRMNKQEILDLLAYVLSAGSPEHSMFQK